MRGCPSRIEFFAQDTVLCAAVTTDTSYLMLCSALLVDDTHVVFEPVEANSFSTIHLAAYASFCADA